MVEWLKAHLQIVAYIPKLHEWPYASEFIQSRLVLANAEPGIVPIMNVDLLISYGSMITDVIFLINHFACAHCVSKIRIFGLA